VLKRKTFLDKIEIIKNIVKGKIGLVLADPNRPLSGFRRGFLDPSVRGASESRTRASSASTPLPLKKPPYHAFLELSLNPYTMVGSGAYSTQPTTGSLGFLLSYYRL